MTTKIQAEVADDADFVLESEVGVANGVAGLDGTGRVPAAQLPASATGALTYQGTWNATTNSPALAGGAGTQGHYYVVGTAGATNLDGVADWQIGDWAVYNGTAWEKADHTDVVSSVFGRQGAVVAVAGDYDGLALDLEDAALTRPKITDYAVQSGALVISAGAVTINVPSGNDFTLGLTANVTSITVNNWPASGTFGKITLRLAQDGTGGRTVAFPGGWKWPNGSLPVMPSAANEDIELVVWTRDGGTTIYAAEVGRKFA